MANLAVIETSGRDLAPQTASEIQTHVNTIQQVMQQVMMPDVHYGVIPGTKEPTLYKPGAEKIMATFRLSADPDVTDLSAPDCIRYLVKVRLVSPSGLFMGAGIGECSTNEEKYKWRRTYIIEEFQETDPDKRREKWVQGYQNKPNYKMQQIRTNPADLANTVLKMAKKRALVDAVLTATAASDCFTQDIEDLPPELRDNPPKQNARPNGVQSDQPNTPERQELIDQLEAKASNGWDALQSMWSGLDDTKRKLVGGEFGRIKKLAEATNAG